MICLTVVLSSCKYDPKDLTLFIPYWAEGRAKIKVVVNEKPLAFGDAPSPYTSISSLPSIVCAPAGQVQEMIRQWNKQNKHIEVQKDRIVQLENKLLQLQTTDNGGL